MSICQSHGYNITSQKLKSDLLLKYTKDVLNIPSTYTAILLNNSLGIAKIQFSFFTSISPSICNLHSKELSHYDISPTIETMYTIFKTASRPATLNKNYKDRPLYIGFYKSVCEPEMRTLLRASHLHYIPIRAYPAEHARCRC